MTFIKFMKRGTMLDDAPWAWGNHWSDDMPASFAADAAASRDPLTGSVPLTYNVFDTLDTNPVTYSNGTPVDPTEYQGEYIGNVIGIY